MLDDKFLLLGYGEYKIMRFIMSPQDFERVFEWVSVRNLRMDNIHWRR